MLHSTESGSFVITSIIWAEKEKKLHMTVMQKEKTIL